jgi:hypothetical protein
MLFRTHNGDLIELKKYNFSNDKLYYEKIMEINKPLLSSSSKEIYFAKLKKTSNNKNN